MIKLLLLRKDFRVWITDGNSFIELPGILHFQIDVSAGQKVVGRELQTASFVFGGGEIRNMEVEYIEADPTLPIPGGAKLK